MRAAGVGHGLEPVCFSWQGAVVGAVRAVWAVRAVRAAGIGHGLDPVKHCFPWQAGGGKCERVVGHGLEPVKHCFSWQGGCGGGGEGSVSGEGGVQAQKNHLELRVFPFKLLKSTTLKP